MRGLALFLLFFSQGTREEKGKYRLSFFGKESGTEEYRLEEFEDGKVVLFSKGKFEITVQGKSQAFAVDAVLTMDRAFAPVLYAGYSKAGPEERRSKIEFSRGLATTESRRPARTAASFLIDNNVFSHFLPLVRSLEPGKRKVKAFSPLLFGDLEVSIEDKGEVVLRGPDRTVRAREFQLTLGYVEMTVDVDEKKRPVRLSSPMTGALAELEGFEGLRVEPRAAEPKLPEGVEESDVSFRSGAVLLAGSVTKPRGKPACPAVVLITGTGPQDRNDNVVRGKPGENFAWEGPDGNLFKWIAYSLARAGLLVLRYDDRGCARSQGDFGTAKLSDFAADAEAAVAFLRTRPDVGPVGLVGHSEGAIIAALVAAQDPKIRAIFLLASPARPLDQILLEQLEHQLRRGGTKEDQRKGLVERQRAIFQSIKQATGDYLEIDERRTFIGWMREHFNHDPAAQLRKVKATRVVMQGLKDQQVFPDNADLLEKASPDAEVRRFASLDHLFMKSEGKIGEGADPDRRVDDEFLTFLAGRALAALK
jgi:pimeloyl-ACP methyl ester carboxylesterase